MDKCACTCKPEPHVRAPRASRAVLRSMMRHAGDVSATSPAYTTPRTPMLLPSRCTLQWLRFLLLLVCTAVAPCLAAVAAVCWPHTRQEQHEHFAEEPARLCCGDHGLVPARVSCTAVHSYSRNYSTPGGAVVTSPATAASCSSSVSSPVCHAGSSDKQQQHMHSIRLSYIDHAASKDMLPNAGARHPTCPANALH
jgi:hypothetical protein